MMNFEDLNNLCGGVAGYERKFTTTEVTWVVDCYGSDEVHTVTVPLQLITREEACDFLGYNPDEFWLRNYELESELHQYCIGLFIEEDCPTNGFSSYPKDTPIGRELDVVDRFIGSYIHPGEDLVITPELGIQVKRINNGCGQFEFEGKVYGVFYGEYFVKDTPFNYAKLVKIKELNEQKKKINETANKHIKTMER